MNSTVAVNTSTMLHSRLSWAAVLAGLTMVLIVHALLNFLSLAWGLSSLSFTQYNGQSPTVNVFFWVLLNNIIAMFVGGWVAGRLSGVKSFTDSLLHGLLTWAITSLVSMLAVMLIAGTLLASTLSFLGTGLGWMGENTLDLVQTIREHPPSVTTKVLHVVPDWHSAFDTVQQQAEQILDLAQKNMNSPPQAKDQLHQQLNQLLMDLLHNTGDLAHRVTQQELNDFLVLHTELDSTQAEQVIDSWQTTYDDTRANINQQVIHAKQTAGVAVDQSAKAVGMLALISFLLLLSGGIFAGLGAVCGKGNSVFKPRAQLML